MFLAELKKRCPKFLVRLYDLMLSLKSYAKYKELTSKNYEIKQSCKGRKCFIIGSGPSLKKHKLTRIKGAAVVSLNNMYCDGEVRELLSESENAYHLVAPIHLPQSTETWVSWLVDMDKLLPQNVVLILGLDRYKFNIYEITQGLDIFKRRKIYWYYAGINFNCNSFDSRHVDFSKMLYKGKAASVYALMFVDFLGVEETYLLGLDHDYFLYDEDSQMRSYSSALHQKDGIQSEVKGDFYTEEMLRQYEIFKFYEALANYSSNKVYNATEGGILRVYPRVKFLDIV